MKKINCMNKECKRLAKFQPKELFSFCSKCKIKYKRVMKETNVWIRNNQEQVREIINSTNEKSLKLYEEEKKLVLEEAQKKGVN